MSDRIRTQPPPFQALASDPPGESEAPAFCSWLRFAKVCQIQLRSHGADGACPSRGRSTVISTVRTLLNSPIASLDADTTARRSRFAELARALPGEARRCPCPPTGLPTPLRRTTPRARGWRVRDAREVQSARDAPIRSRTTSSLFRARFLLRAVTRSRARDDLPRRSRAPRRAGGDR